MLPKKTFTDLKDELSKNSKTDVLMFELISDLLIKRNHLKMSQKELSRLTGLSQGSISNIESGIRLPKLETYLIMADALDLEVKVHVKNKKSHMKLVISRTALNEWDKTEDKTHIFDVPVSTFDIVGAFFNPGRSFEDNLKMNVFKITHTQLPFNYTVNQSDIMKDIKYINYMSKLFINHLDHLTVSRFIFGVFNFDEVITFAEAVNTSHVITEEIDKNNENLLSDQDVDYAMSKIIDDLTNRYYNI